MAIISHLPGLKVAIEVDGRTAKEYDAPQDVATTPEGLSFHPLQPVADGADPYIVKYIESIPDTRFAIRVEVEPKFRFHGAAVNFYSEIDGQKAPSSHLIHWKHEGEISRYKHQHCGWERSWGVGSNEEGWTDKYFRFAPLETDDGDAPKSVVEAQLARAKKLGVIRIVFRSVKSVRDKVLVKPCKLYENSNNKMHEKSLKGRALDCAVSFETSQIDRRTRKFTNVAYTDKKGRPFAVFEFRYRSMDGLIKEGIVPRLSFEEQVNNMPEGEVRRLAQEMLALRETVGPLRVKSENVRGIKREFHDLEADVSLSDEVFLARYKGRKLNNGKIQIDLTDD